MKADAVYKVVRDVLQPLCKQLGFKRIGSLGWTAHVSESEHFTFWFQLSRDGWDDYAGSSFVVEFQRAPSPTPGAWGQGTRRNRLGDLLSSEDRALITPMQNDVIRKLRKPPRTHFMYSLDAGLIEYYESKFLPLDTPFEGATCGSATTIRSTSSVGPSSFAIDSRRSSRSSRRTMRM